MTDQVFVSRCDGLVEAEVDGEIVALHVENGTCYGFNETATRIWQLLDQPKPFSEIRDILVSEFQVQREECERDLQALLKELEADGLVELRKG